MKTYLTDNSPVNLLVTHMVEPFSGHSHHILSPHPINKLLFHNESVAVIESSAKTTALLGHYLTTAGFNVLTGASMTELYDLLEREKIALILLDTKLPDRNGNDIIQDLISSYPHLGIIIITGSTDIEVAVNWLRGGAEGYLTKPVNIDLLHHTVKTVLEKRRLTVDNRQFQEELQKTKDLLDHAEHFSSIGQMAVQLVHTIRNSLTSIGGTSRLLERKTTDPYTTKFLNIITEEAAKIETALKDLVSAVAERQHHRTDKGGEDQP